MSVKNLIFIGGTMGAGKTAVARQLLKDLPACVMLDGDWCWMADPFVVNDETKEMVTGNITYMLSQFLDCAAYENVVFCWVMDHQSLIDELMMRLKEQTSVDFRFFDFSLVLSPEALEERLTKDVETGIREPDIIDRSIARQPLYNEIDSVKIDVSNCTPKEAAGQIIAAVYPKDYSTNS